MTTTQLPAPGENPDTTYNPMEVARFLRAFVECNREMQGIVAEMSAIVGDDAASEDDRIVAFDAMVEALFPGTTTDVLEKYHDKLKSPEAAQAAASLRAEERAFADAVRNLMLKKNITQEQLAKAAGIGQPAVSNILARRCRPQRRTVARFAEAFGVSPAELWPEYNES